MLAAVHSDVPQGAWLVAPKAPLPPDDDTLGVLAWVHDPLYLEKVRQVCLVAPGYVDSQDCRVSAGSFGAALAASGLALQAALDLVNGRLVRAFLAVRPPAHHAERGRAAGYCLLNHIALAAEVVTRCWAAPVLIADFDALHGSGTERLFWERGDVGVLSVHRYPGFPGSGAATDVGEGAGHGLTVNVPLAAGSGDEVVVAAFRRALEDLGRRLRPAAVLLAAGFSAHADDPLGSLRVSTEGFRRLTEAAVEVAETWSGGRILSFLEGGFEVGALAASARAHVEALAGWPGGSEECSRSVH